jgi:RimJ/RimL family protein N-acetyltransferase/D-alanyl-D-alanine dipeptidase
MSLMEMIDLARIVDLAAMARPANFFLDDVFARVREGAPLGPRIFTSANAPLLVDGAMARLLVEAAVLLSSRGFGLKILSALRTAETQRYLRDVADDLGLPEEMVQTPGASLHTRAAAVDLALTGEDGVNLFLRPENAAHYGGSARRFENMAEAASAGVTEGMCALRKVLDAAMEEAAAKVKAHLHGAPGEYWHYQIFDGGRPDYFAENRLPVTEEDLRAAGFAGAAISAGEREAQEEKIRTGNAEEVRRIVEERERRNGYVFESDGFSLRPIEPARDTDLLHELYGDDFNNALVAPVRGKTREDAALIARRFSELHRRDGVTLWVIESEETGRKEEIGICGLTYRGERGGPLSLNRLLRRGVQGRHIGTRLHRLMQTFCFEALHQPAMHSVTLSFNGASAASNRRAGMRPFGTAEIEGAGVEVEVEVEVERQYPKDDYLLRFVRTRDEYLSGTTVPGESSSPHPAFRTMCVMAEAQGRKIADLQTAGGCLEGGAMEALAAARQRIEAHEKLHDRVCRPRR